MHDSIPSLSSSSLSESSPPRISLIRSLTLLVDRILLGTAPGFFEFLASSCSAATSGSAPSSSASSPRISLIRSRTLPPFSGTDTIAFGTVFAFVPLPASSN